MNGNNRILIVDDESEARSGYVQFLNPTKQSAVRRSSRSRSADQSSPSVPKPSSSGPEFEILEASTGEEAVALFKKEKNEGRPIAAGFFDVKLGPGIDGLEVIRQIKSIDEDILCVVVTAYQDRSVEDIGDFFGENFKDRWDFLTKPFTQGEIVQKARQMVASWNRKKQLEITQKQLIASERLAAIGQVARGVGHEFGNILQRILGKSDLALMENDLEKMKSHVEIIMKASERAGVIVKNLQSFSKTTPQKKMTAITEPIQEALSLVNHEFIKHSIQVDEQLQSKASIEIDSGAIGQVFLNLFINAMHAMDQGGTLEITATDQDQSVEVKVKDSGKGMDPETLNQIFDFAFTTKGEKGSGIGLSVTKQIMDAHRAQIQVQSQLGQGTIFTLSFPRT